jgi:hypothetical protein
MARNRILLGACVLFVALPGLAAAQLPDVNPVPISGVAEKLGAKLTPSSPQELEFGRSVTMTLVDPAKLLAYGIKDMHEGARVTITCVGPDRVRVEADEMEPVQHRGAVTLRVGEDGKLTAVPERAGPGKPPAP